MNNVIDKLLINYTNSKNCYKNINSEKYKKMNIIFSLSGVAEIILLNLSNKA